MLLADAVLRSWRCQCDLVVVQLRLDLHTTIKPPPREREKPSPLLSRALGLFVHAVMHQTHF